LCGFSQNVTQLILFRLFHGIGASMTQSQARALAMDSLPRDSSGKAQGFMTTAFHSGVLVGPSIGGLIIDYVHWRAVFFSLVPIAAAGIALAVINHNKGNMPERPSAHAMQPEIDYLGAMLLVAATVALIAIVDYRIMEAVAGLLRVGLIAGFIVLFAGFLYRESSTSSPILDLSLFRIRMFTLSSLSLLLVGVAQVMIGFVLPFYLQDILHLSPSFMGVLFISAPIFTVILSPLVGWVTDKVGPRLPATVGLSFLVIGAFLGGFLRAESHWTFAVAVLALWGLAMALFYPPNHTAMISSVPDQHRGVATGAIYVMFGLGTTFGVSLSTLMLTAAFRYYSGDATAMLTPANAVVFVKSMNFSFFMSGIMACVAMLCSAMRGPKRVLAHALP
jgi:MFS family permease